jgi:hypothetical protein
LALLWASQATAAATAADNPPEDAAARPAAAGEKPAGPKKQWVWLKSQNCWGYGYQRADGLWVIDPGSKRRPAEAPAQQQPQQPAGDPYGFLGWLNATRAGFGLAPVGVDPNLTNWASANNAQQQARGMGHHVMGPARRQNCAMGSSSSIGGMWMASPAHRSALLDPTIRMIGIAGLGAYWTFNAY